MNYKGITREGRLAAGYFGLSWQEGDGVGRGVNYRVTTEEVFVEGNPLGIDYGAGEPAFCVRPDGFLDATTGCVRFLAHRRRVVEDAIRKGGGDVLRDVEMIVCYPRTWGIARR